MKIVYVLNKITYTSIPVEMANKLSNYEDVSIISLYDSYEDDLITANELAPNCKLICCNGRKNIILGLRDLKNELRAGEFDIIHTHQTLSGAWARYVSRNFKNSKTVHTIHANHESFSKYQNFIIGITLNYADYIISNSQTTLKGLKKWQKRIIRRIPQKVIYNGVNFNEVINADRNIAKSIITQDEIDGSKYIFATVGRLVKVKNHETILDAFDIFLSNVNDTINYRLLLIGDGPERTNIEKRISSSSRLSESVILTGSIDRNAVYSILHEIDVFIMASFHEGFCNALMEARVLGVKTIVSNIEIFSELYDEGEMMGFNPYDANELSTLIQKAISIPKSNILDNKVRDKYDISMCTKLYLELYYELLHYRGKH